MITNRDITLGFETFRVPPLPIRWNREVYPLCARLSESDLETRWLVHQGKLRFDDQEFADLCDIAWYLTRAAGAEFDRATFDAWPINSVQLMLAFYAARYQTGVWIPVESPDGAGNEPDQQPGESIGEPEPRKKRRRK